MDWVLIFFPVVVGSEDLSPPSLGMQSEEAMASAAVTAPQLFPVVVCSEDLSSPSLGMQSEEAMSSAAVSAPQLFPVVVGSEDLSSPSSGMQSEEAMVSAAVSAPQLFPVVVGSEDLSSPSSGMQSEEAMASAALSAPQLFPVVADSEDLSFPSLGMQSEEAMASAAVSAPQLFPVVAGSEDLSSPSLGMQSEEAVASAALSAPQLFQVVVGSEDLSSPSLGMQSEEAMASAALSAPQLFPVVVGSEDLSSPSSGMQSEEAMASAAVSAPQLFPVVVGSEDLSSPSLGMQSEEAMASAVLSAPHLLPVDEAPRMRQGQVERVEAGRAVVRFVAPRGMWERCCIVRGEVVFKGQRRPFDQPLTALLEPGMPVTLHTLQEVGEGEECCYVAHTAEIIDCVKLGKREFFGIVTAVAATSGAVLVTLGGGGQLALALFHKNSVLVDKKVVPAETPLDSVISIGWPVTARLGLNRGPEPDFCLCASRLNVYSDENMRQNIQQALEEEEQIGVVASCNETGGVVHLAGGVKVPFTTYCLWVNGVRASSTVLRPGWRVRVVHSERGNAHIYTTDAFVLGVAADEGLWATVVELSELAGVVQFMLAGRFERAIFFRKAVISHENDHAARVPLTGVVREGQAVHVRITLCHSAVSGCAFKVVELDAGSLADAAVEVPRPPEVAASPKAKEAKAVLSKDTTVLQVKEPKTVPLVVHLPVDTPKKVSVMNGHPLIVQSRSSPHSFLTSFNEEKGKPTVHMKFVGRVVKAMPKSATVCFSYQGVIGLSGVFMKCKWGSPVILEDLEDQKGDHFYKVYGTSLLAKKARALEEEGEAEEKSESAATTPVGKLWHCPITGRTSRIVVYLSPDVGVVEVAIGSPKQLLRGAFGRWDVRNFEKLGKRPLRNIWPVGTSVHFNGEVVGDGLEKNVLIVTCVWPQGGAALMASKQPLANSETKVSPVLPQPVPVLDGRKRSISSACSSDATDPIVNQCLLSRSGSVIKYTDPEHGWVSFRDLDDSSILLPFSRTLVAAKCALVKGKPLCEQWPPGTQLHFNLKRSRKGRLIITHLWAGHNANRILSASPVVSLPSADSVPARVIQFRPPSACIAAITQDDGSVATVFVLSTHFRPSRYESKLHCSTSLSDYLSLGQFIRVVVKPTINVSPKRDCDFVAVDAWVEELDEAIVPAAPAVCVAPAPLAAASQVPPQPALLPPPALTPPFDGQVLSVSDTAAVIRCSALAVDVGFRREEAFFCGASLTGIALTELFRFGDHVTFRVEQSKAGELPRAESGAATSSLCKKDSVYVIPVWVGAAVGALTAQFVELTAFCRDRRLPSPTRLLLTQRLGEGYLRGGTRPTGPSHRFSSDSEDEEEEEVIATHVALPSSAAAKMEVGKTEEQREGAERAPAAPAARPQEAVVSAPGPDIEAQQAVAEDVFRLELQSAGPEAFLRKRLTLLAQQVFEEALRATEHFFEEAVNEVCQDTALAKDLLLQSPAIIRSAAMDTLRRCEPSVAGGDGSSLTNGPRFSHSAVRSYADAEPQSETGPSLPLTASGLQTTYSGCQQLQRAGESEQLDNKLLPAEQLLLALQVAPVPADPGETGEDLVKDGVEKVPRDVPKNVHEDISKNIHEKISRDVSKDIRRGRGTVKDVPKNTVDHANADSTDGWSDMNEEDDASAGEDGWTDCEDSEAEPTSLLKRAFKSIPPRRTSSSAAQPASGQPRSSVEGSDGCCNSARGHPRVQGQEENLDEARLLHGNRGLMDFWSALLEAEAQGEVGQEAGQEALDVQAALCEARDAFRDIKDVFEVERLFKVVRTAFREVRHACRNHGPGPRALPPCANAPAIAAAREVMPLQETLDGISCSCEAPHSDGRRSLPPEHPSGGGHLHASSTLAPDQAPASVPPAALPTTTGISGRRGVVPHRRSTAGRRSEVSSSGVAGVGGAGDASTIRSPSADAAYCSTNPPPDTAVSLVPLRKKTRNVDSEHTVTSTDRAVQTVSTGMVLFLNMLHDV